MHEIIKDRTCVSIQNITHKWRTLFSPCVQVAHTFYRIQVSHCCSDCHGPWPFLSIFTLIINQFIRPKHSQHDPICNHLLHLQTKPALPEALLSKTLYRRDCCAHVDNTGSAVWQIFKHLKAVNHPVSLDISSLTQIIKQCDTPLTFTLQGKCC